jgi:hypothetical protein
MSATNMSMKRYWVGKETWEGHERDLSCCYDDGSDGETTCR